MDGEKLSPDELAERRRERHSMPPDDPPDYPPWSAPASLQLARFEPHPVVATDTGLEGDRARPPKVRAWTTRDREALLPGERAIVTVHTLAEGKPVPAEVKSVSFMRTRRDPREVVGMTAPTFHDDGVAPDTAANDGVLTAVVEVPPQGLDAFVGTFALVATIRAAGEEGDVGWIFADSGPPPAALTGVGRDLAEEGSLSIYLGVRVRRAGLYRMTGRLYDAEARPVTVLEFTGSLATSTTEVRLVGFGKVLRDAGGASPYALRDVEGWLVEANGERTFLREWRGPHGTATYAPDAFSDAPWVGTSPP